MEQSLEFKGLKRRNTAYNNSNLALNAKPAEKKSRKLEVLPKEIKKYNISGKMILSLFYIVCIGLFIGSILMYISLQGDLATSVDKIASLQSQYETLKKNNDAELAAINNSIDNEEVRRVAIEKLGMHYASEGQIVTYTENYTNDYVRVLSTIK